MVGARVQTIGPKIVPGHMQAYCLNSLPRPLVRFLRIIGVFDAETNAAYDAAVSGDFAVPDRDELEDMVQNFLLEQQDIDDKSFQEILVDVEDDNDDDGE